MVPALLTCLRLFALHVAQSPSYGQALEQDPLRRVRTLLPIRSQDKLNSVARRPLRDYRHRSCSSWS